jgi:hypothetical protein
MAGTGSEAVVFRIIYYRAENCKAFRRVATLFAPHVAVKEINNSRVEE